MLILYVLGGERENFGVRQTPYSYFKSVLCKNLKMLSERRFCFQQCYLAWSEVLLRFLGELSVNLDCFKLYLMKYVLLVLS